ncbi:MAG: DUF3105 domain-containing protein [Acidimicrobiales bacterium]|nr:DUF3105 domain-containing protein [Acidimicrobiales bacterium]
MRFIGAFALLAMVITGCGDDASSSCTEVREPEDPLSIQHVIDPEAVQFDGGQPTSGPHLSGPSPVGALESPLAPAAQVNVLESGSILVQYDASIDPGMVDPLAERTDVDIVVAPGEELSTPIVATAWTWKLTCNSLDVERIVSFAAARSGDAPGDD